MLKKSVAMLAAAVAVTVSVAGAPASSAGTSAECNAAYTQSVKEARADYASAKKDITAVFTSEKKAMSADLAADLAAAKEIVDELKAAFDVEYAKMRANPTAEQGEILNAAQKAVAQARDDFRNYSQNRRAAYRLDRNDLIEVRRDSLMQAQAVLRADIAEARADKSACRKG